MPTDPTPTPPSKRVRIDRLELNNFKSYLGKVVVGPFNSFSCIVGPNGAGKSNVMDALSFVLGTSATALRGRKPADFINRKSAKSECSVTLVLRNATDEFKLMRSVNTKGQITVAFNGKEVSDKEFLDVLRKLGISSRTNTFLIFQHEVEALAQRKPKELTDLIEQISGSVEYKPLYEAKRKALLAADEGLTNASVEKRGAVAEVNQMRLHKKEAERYAEVNGQLIEARHVLALGELFHIEHTLSKERAGLEELERQLRELEKGGTSEEALRKLKQQYADKHKAYLEVLKTGRQVSIEAREKQQVMDRISTSIDHYKRKQEQLKAELAIASDSNNKRSKETSRLTAELNNQNALMEAFNKECAEEDKKGNPQGKLNAQQAAQYTSLKRQADIKTITQRQELETVLRQLDSLTEASKQAEIAKETQEASLAENSRLIENTQERVKTVEQRAKDSVGSIKDYEAKIKDANDRLQLAKARRSEHGTKLRDIENQLHDLRHVKEDSRQSTKNSEALQALKALYKGVRGRLVDLCIPEERYRNAVTVALGKNLEAVVVDTTETALGCVRYLKEQRLVSMTFIPLNNVQGRPVDDSIRTFGGTCKPIADVIKFDVSLEPAIRYAIGQALVCDAIAEARKVAYQSGDGQRYKVVTLEGTVLLKNGSIQGGLATIQSRARKWDEKKYDDLKAARDSILAEAAGGSEAEEARIQIEIKDLESRLEAAKRRIDSSGNEVSLIKSQIATFTANAQKAKDSIAEQVKKLAAYTKAIESCKGEADKLQKVVSAAEAEIFKDFKKVVGIEDIAELERKETLKARIRAEKRRQFAVVIQKLKFAVEAESKRVGVSRPEALDEAIKKNDKDLQACDSERTLYKKTLEQTVKTAKDASDKTISSKAELDQLEATIRKNSQNSEHDMRKLFEMKKNITIKNATCNALRQQRVTLFERCVMNEIEIPTKAPEDVGSKRGRESNTVSSRGGRQKHVQNDDDGETEDIVVSEAFLTYATTGTQANSSTNARTLTRAATSIQTSVCIDFSALDNDVRREMISRPRFESYKHQAESTIDQLERELETIAPNLKATTKFGVSEQKLGQSNSHVEKARENHRVALAEFHQVKELRTARFNTTLETLVVSLDKIYGELTVDTRGRNIVGTAYLTAEEHEEPYNGGTKFHVVPPLKRFMTIDALSGGERTMAALALLFAIHSIAPTPFFVLDEVDAALDSGNVQKLAEYLVNHASDCQYIVVSLKEQQYHKADSLVGVFKDQMRESSGIITLDLKKFSSGKH